MKLKQHAAITPINHKLNVADVLEVVVTVVVSPAR